MYRVNNENVGCQFEYKYLQSRLYPKLLVVSRWNFLEIFNFFKGRFEDILNDFNFPENHRGSASHVPSKKKKIWQVFSKNHDPMMLFKYLCMLIPLQTNLFWCSKGIKSYKRRMSFFLFFKLCFILIISLYDITQNSANFQNSNQHTWKGTTNFR